ncbi:hypothetical protein IQ238_19100 [Pleurocapsales cyanobacterium LEGE 06147]|nr:hypothetical protein [Pleurocapsales cyanobacterium LEGE 06147]
MPRLSTQLNRIIKYVAIGTFTMALVIISTITFSSLESSLAHIQVAEAIISGTSQSPEITGTITNASPEEYGFYIHEFSPDGTSSWDRVYPRLALSNSPYSVTRTFLYPP